MAASGYTPIILFNSTTTGNTPTTSNLAVGELAINVTDGKLFFNQSGTIKVLANATYATSVSTISFGTTGLTPSTATNGVVTVAGTLAVANGGTGVTTSTGSGNNVLSTSPTFVTPILGTPTSVTLTNATGLPLTTGVTGTLPVANGGTNLTSFTANGVVYASSTSALATGSALTFDGTYFGVGSGNSSMKIGADGANNFQIFNGALTPDGTNFALEQNYLGTNTVLNAASGGQLLFRIGNSNNAVLTSTGLGIGTSSPAYKLNVLAGAGSQNIFQAGQSGVSNGYTIISNGTNLTHQWYNGGSEAMRLDTAGNLGLGVTPNTWGTLSKAIEFGSYGSVSSNGSSGGAYLSNNACMSTNNDATGWVYKVSDAGATLYRQELGSHAWYSAGSGSQGASVSFTQAMTLNTSGNLGVGTSSPAYKLDVNGAINYSSGILGYTGTAVPSGANNQGLYLPIYAIGLGGTYGSVNFPTTSAALTTTAWWQIGRPSGSDDAFTIDCRLGGASVLRQGYKIVSSGTDAAKIVDNHQWHTNGSERARINSSGNLLVGTTSQLINESSLGVNSTGNTVTLKCTGSAGDGIQPLLVWNSGVTGDNGFVSFFTETSYTARGTITYNRGAGLVAYNVTSDYRAKDIYGPVVDSGALIDSVPVYMGKMKGATQERPMFIAHEVPAYAHTGEKDAVDADGKPVYQQMDTSALVPVMWAEIQSLRKRILTLENK